MNIKFKLETVGYMVAEFSATDKIIKIGHSSSYGDKFQELLNKFFFIYEIISTKEENHFPFAFELLWEDDFVNYEWNVNIDSAQSAIRVKIFELSPTNRDHKVELVNGESQIEDFFNNIYLSLNELLSGFGFIGYKKNWETGNFPIFEYIVLKAKKEQLIMQTIRDAAEEWKQKINPEDELKVIGF